ncbi:hypothetical protein FDECE_7585 [Fusarium decemcellulare]|nr:hypothetical protein FDECE_7585 [Fusarium decemcellulare]
MASSTPSFRELQRRFKEPTPAATAFYYGVAAHLMYFVNSASEYVRAVKDMFFTPADGPSLVKSYACRPSLPIRIFIPKSYDPKSEQKLPTLFSIHGGGFVLGNARDDDTWNRPFADTQSVLVIALNYSQAPRARFPTPIYDIEQVILATLSDSTLPIDRDHVAIAGFSAGGNLALSVSTLPSMSGSGDGSRRLQAVVPMYPVADISIPREHKTQTRRYKPSLGGFRGKPRDYLLRISPIFDWAYTPPNQDLQNPLLSPIFAQKEQLPAYVFVVGCELDMLAGESWRLIRRLVDHPIEDERVGRDEPGRFGELILDDERYSFEQRSETGSYKWLLIPDQIHGFDHYVQMQPMHRDKNHFADAELKTLQCQNLIGQWLFSGPFR